MIIYDEPVPGLDKKGKEITCNRQVHMTNSDAVCYQRYVTKHVNPKLKLTPERLLDEFMIVNWAKEVL